MIHERKESVSRVSITLWGVIACIVLALVFVGFSLKKKIAAARKRAESQAVVEEKATLVDVMTITPRVMDPEVPIPEWPILDAENARIVPIIEDADLMDESQQPLSPEWTERFFGWIGGVFGIGDEPASPDEFDAGAEEPIDPED